MKYTTYREFYKKSFEQEPVHTITKEWDNINEAIEHIELYEGLELERYILKDEKENILFDTLDEKTQNQKIIEAYKKDFANNPRLTKRQAKKLKKSLLTDNQEQLKKNIEDCKRFYFEEIENDSLYSELAERCPIIQESFYMKLRFLNLPTFGGNPKEITMLFDRVYNMEI